MIKFTVWAAIMILLLATLSVLSWVTTKVTWHGQMPAGRWDIRVQDDTGTPLAGACMTLLGSEGKPLAFNDEDAGRGPFDNYTGPGSVCTGETGMLHLYNSQQLSYGGTCWKYMWIWPVGEAGATGPMSLVVRISASGHDEDDVTVGELLDKGELTVTLENSDQ